jgi:hypothetical protein
MNAKQLIAVVAAMTVTGIAFAGENTEYIEQGKFTSTKSRAEVRAELEQAQAQGWRPGSNPEFVEFANTRASATGSANRVAGPTSPTPDSSAKPRN